MHRFRKDVGAVGNADRPCPQLNPLCEHSPEPEKHSRAWEPISLLQRKPLDSSSSVSSRHHAPLRQSGAKVLARKQPEA